MSESNASEPVDHEAESDDNAAGQEGQDPEVALSDEGLAQSQEPEDPLAIAEAKAAENLEKYVRAVAELDNVRKRARGGRGSRCGCVARGQRGDAQVIRDDVDEVRN